MHITLIAGARPNFVKISPIIHAIQAHNAVSSEQVNYALVHTGQHYDRQMSDSFFEDLNIPAPDVNLNVGSHSHAEQTARIMVAFEKYLTTNATDCVLVVGDVNSTMACAIVAKKMNIKVVHVEGGLRSGDMTMPEEVNRLVTDAISDYFFTTSEIANGHLRREGVSEDRILLVGNTMIDSLVNSLGKVKKPMAVEGIDLADYYLLTLHRPSNVDEQAQLLLLLSTIDELANGRKVIFPIHPRTTAQLGDKSLYKNIVFVTPLPYLEFLYLMKGASAVITDSGGIQEETTFLKVPCLTLRENTERPETIEIGSNELIGMDMNALAIAMAKIQSQQWKSSAIPPLWDGKASQRIVAKLVELWG
ncbi:non-hydrolyzing UDP-N-acetylglucosamine 2-epimerase [Roseivirga echinicomitans]